MTKYKTGVAFSGMSNSDNSPTRTKLNKKYTRAMKHKLSYIVKYGYKNCETFSSSEGAGLLKILYLACLRISTIQFPRILPPTAPVH
jgi:hypothetical protein